MSTGKPKWRQVFDRVERAVGGPLEDVAASNRFVDVMAVGLKVRRAASGTAWRAVHGVTGTVLRAADIPTRDDVRRLNNHLITLASEVRALEQAQRAAITPARPAAARSANSRSATPRSAQLRVAKATKPALAGKEGTDVPTDD